MCEYFGMNGGLQKKLLLLLMDDILYFLNKVST